MKNIGLQDWEGGQKYYILDKQNGGEIEIPSIEARQSATMKFMLKDPIPAGTGPKNLTLAFKRFSSDLYPVEVEVTFNEKKQKSFIEKIFGI